MCGNFEAFFCIAALKQIFFFGIRQRKRRSLIDKIRYFSYDGI